MTYTVGVPADGQSLANSKPQIRSNFTVINTAFSVNHVAFGATGAGKHKFVDLVEQGIDPVPTVGTDTLFTKVASAFGELFYVRGGGTPIQMTKGNVKSAANGYTFLPGGILLQWGTATITTYPQSVVFLTAGNIDFPTVCWQVLAQSHISVINSGSVWSVVGVSTTGFTLNYIPGGGGTPSGTTFSWLAIGN